MQVFIQLDELRMQLMLIFITSGYFFLLTDKYVLLVKYQRTGEQILIRSHIYKQTDAVKLVW